MPSLRSGVRAAPLLEAAALFLGATIIVGLLVVSRVVAPLDGIIHDAIVRALPTAPDPRILIVGIDDASIAAVGRWPWSRAVHANVIDRLTEANARTIGYDVLFVEPGPGDAELQGALERSRRVALPLLVTAPVDGGVKPTVQRPVVRPAATGHVMVRADPDGVFRRVTLNEPIAGGTVAHLAAATLTLGGFAPDVRGMLIPFTGPAGHYPIVSAAAVLRGEVPSSLIEGRFVLVGATASGLGDRFATPMGGQRDLMAGVEVQANIVQGLLDGGLRRDAGDRAAFLLAALAVFALGMGFVRLSPRANLLAALLLFAGVVATSTLLLAFAGLWVAPATALVTMIVIFPVWGWRRLARASGFLEQQLAALGIGDECAPTQGHDPLARQIAMLDAATTRMARLRMQRDETLAFLSHDLRGPAAAIIGLVPHEDRIAGHARRLLRLADQFVQGVRAEEAPLVVEPVELASLLDEAADQCWEAAQRVGGNIAVTCDCDLPEIATDRALMARAVVNLIENALKYGGECPAVAVRGWFDAGHAVVTVADRGGGMDSVQVSRLFAPFDRAGATRPDGAGLGLAIVATYARRQEGKVGCVSRVGIGTLFELRVPVLGQLNVAVDGPIVRVR